MATYLFLDGVDDNLTTPSITFDEVIMDITPEKTLGTEGYYIDARTGTTAGYLLSSTTEVNSFGATFSAVYVDGVSKTSGTSFVPNNQRSTLRITLATAGTDDVKIFSFRANTSRMKGRVHSVKFLNVGTTVAHYDMSLGNVNDISGNGKHATLVGGTWLDDGAGGGTAYTKSLSDSVSFTDAISKSLSVAVVDTVTTSEAENEQATKVLSDSIAITDTIAKALSKFHSDSVSTSETDSETVTKQLLDSLTQTDSITTTKGKAVVLSDSLSVMDSISKAVSRLQVDSVTFTESFTKQSAQSVRLYDVVVTTDTLSIFNPNAPDLIGVIRLKGQRDLYVYLQGNRDLYVYLKGNRELNVILKGGIDVAETNQNFSMIAGDTKSLVVTLPETLTGASVKWVIKKSVTSTENALLKTTASGITLSGTDITIKLNPADTLSLAGTYYHECEVTDQLNNVSTVFTGKCSISKNGI